MSDTEIILKALAIPTILFAIWFIGFLFALFIAGLVSSRGSYAYKPDEGDYALSIFWPVTIPCFILFSLALGFCKLLSILLSKPIETAYSLGRKLKFRLIS